MQQLKEKTDGLLLLTATPMQVHPLEIWDLLDLLGLPEEWTPSTFLEFFDKVASGNPSNDELETLSSLFRATEASLGATALDDVLRFVDGGSRLKTKKILKALRDRATNLRHKLDSDQRQAALRILRANTPVARLISRHTRGLLRHYYEAGKIDTPIATRRVRDEFVTMSTAERDLYEAVENYISSTYNAAADEELNAVGFVMTIYRRRVASSFAALAHTLQKRVASLDQPSTSLNSADEDLSDDELADETMDSDEATELERAALKEEERADLEYLLEQAKELPADTKAEVLLNELEQLKGNGYEQVMVFTQYTDTLDFLRDHLRDVGGHRVLCFSGRGGELPNQDGTWRTVTRGETKRLFRDGKAEVMVCTDAAAEGLNFQFCGAVINYDMPWNPMRVEQRIGRIDRLGQRFEEIHIVNLHYEDTVEADVYRALRERIGLFQDFVGKLQPILAQLPKAIGEAGLVSKPERERQRRTLVSDLDTQVREAETTGFDLDEAIDANLEAPRRPQPSYDLDALDQLIQRRELLPPGADVSPLDPGEYRFSMPGMREPFRVTTRADLFEEHPGSLELWSPGGVLFPKPEEIASADEIAGVRRLTELLGNPDSVATDAPSD
jgi:hypothetical protein